MKYGETSFDILYLLIAFVFGIMILVRSRDKAGKLMGVAVLVLGGGDAFHLIPRILNYFIDGDFTAGLGIGKLVTSLTMTVFYVLMYCIYVYKYRVGVKGTVVAVISLLTAARFILCAMPQNHWLENQSDMTWGIIRNVPFVILGVIIVVLYYKKRAQVRPLRFTWLLVTLSFLFYMPVAVFAGIVPVLGALMLPKTVCYIILIFTFYFSNKRIVEDKNE